MARTALITGASSGLGAEFARQLAARGTALVLVSSEESALEEMASELAGRFGVEVEGIIADLLVEQELGVVVRRLTDSRRPIDMLVNSAGFGQHLRFERNDIDDEVRHLHLLVEVPMRLTHAALGPMLQRGGGRIVNIASVAGFIPFSTYGACKAWLISFSAWANSRYSARGVTVTAVCPGFTHTRFHERMGLPEREIGLPGWLWLHAPDVVAAGLRDIARGKALSVPTWRYKAAVVLSRILPARIIATVGARKP